MSNQIFNVREAVPPTDYEAPYSQMPSNVDITRVKQKVKNSYKEMAKQKAKEITQKIKHKPLPVPSRKNDLKLPPIDPKNNTVAEIKAAVRSEMKEKQEHWINLLNLEHADALISDAFWYVICKICNPRPEFEQHQEFLLDRIAANFVSFTLIEDRKYTEDSKKQFFKKFYDIISQAVYYSLYYAYPKSRKSLDEHFIRDLISTFSELFTGTQIHSATTTHWEQFAVVASVGKPKAQRGGKDPSLGDNDMMKNTRTRREKLFMRYSPLVERYLITHNYETINNVRKWKMLLT